MGLPPSIEYAGGGGRLPDAVIQTKLARAPSWVRRDVDRYREQRGLAPLFAVRAAVAAPRRSPPSPAARPKTPLRYTLHALLAPGVSEPTGVRDHEPVLPEFITMDCWRSMLRAIREGRHCDIRCGHNAAAHVLARSCDPHCRLTYADRVGLVLQLDLRDTDSGRWPEACSIGFQPLAWHTERRGGRLIRFIDDARLDHVALFEQRKERPVYPLAECKRGVAVITARFDDSVKLIAQARAAIQKTAPWILG